MSEPRQGKWGLWYIEGSSVAYATRQEAADALGSKKGAGQRGITALIALVCAVALFAWVGKYWWDKGADDRARDARIEQLRAELDQSRRNALGVCRKAISRTAAYGTSNDPGYAKGQEAPGTWVFLWPQGSFHFKNGFGVDTPQWARCEVHMDTGRVTTLIVTGRAIISN